MSDSPYGARQSDQTAGPMGAGSVWTSDPWSGHWSNGANVGWDSAETSGQAGGRVNNVNGVAYDQGGRDILNQTNPNLSGRIDAQQAALAGGTSPTDVAATMQAGGYGASAPAPTQQAMSAGLAPYAQQMRYSPPPPPPPAARGGQDGAWDGIRAQFGLPPIGSQPTQYTGPQMPMQSSRAPYQPQGGGYQPMGGGYQSFGMGGYQMPSYNSNPFLNQAYTTMQGGFQVPSFLGGPMGGLSQILGPAINAMAYAPWAQPQQNQYQSQYQSPYQSGYSAYGRQQGGYPQQQPYQQYQQPYQQQPYGGGYPQQPYNPYQSYGGYGGYPSYDVGTYNVPKDQLAMVHQGETIIPSNVAKPMRDMGIIPQDGPVSKGVGTMPVSGYDISSPMGGGTMPVSGNDISSPTSMAQTLTKGTPNDLPPLPNPASKESSINPMAYGLAPYAKPAPATNAWDQPSSGSNDYAGMWRDQPSSGVGGYARPPMTYQPPDVAKTSGWDQTTSTAAAPAAPTYDMAAKQAAVAAWNQQRSAAGGSGSMGVGGGTPNPWGNTPYGPTQTSDPTQAYTSALPAPHQINPQQWMNLDPDTQQFLLGAYAAAGYSPNNVQWTINQLLPGQTSAGANPWGRIGA